MPQLTHRRHNERTHLFARPLQRVTRKTFHQRAVIRLHRFRALLAIPIRVIKPIVIRLHRRNRQCRQRHSRFGVRRSAKSKRSKDAAEDYRNKQTLPEWNGSSHNQNSHLSSRQRADVNGYAPEVEKAQEKSAMVITHALHTFCQLRMCGGIWTNSLQNIFGKNVEVSHTLYSPAASDFPIPRCTALNAGNIT